MKNILRPNQAKFFPEISKKFKKVRFLWSQSRPGPIFCGVWGPKLDPIKLDQKSSQFYQAAPILKKNSFGPVARKIVEIKFN